MPQKSLTRWFAMAVIAVLSMSSVAQFSIVGGRVQTPAQSNMGNFPPQVTFTGDGDHKNMMEQLGVKKLRPGADPNNQTTFNEATANQYPLPELMVMKDGKKVTTAKQWAARRAEIQEDFEREIYGRIPGNVPKV